MELKETYMSTLTYDEKEKGYRDLKYPCVIFKKK